MKELTGKLSIQMVVVFAATALTALVGIPLYAIHSGITRPDWILCLAFVLATGLSITVGYHRLLAHSAFQANPLVLFFCLVFGAAAWEQSALMWASQHRAHHRYVDTTRDPYNIKQGFWHAHIGWMLFPTFKTDYTNVKDLSTNPLIMHQHRHYGLWAITGGVFLPVAIGAATGHLLGAILLSVAFRLAFVHHTTFFINSVCHTFGKATYDIDVSARDHWFVAFLTNGEGYHNFPHRSAGDYRNGARWYQWDPSKWVIALLSLCGLATKLYRATPHMILAARVATEHKRVERELGRQRHKDISALLVTLREHYARLKTALREWEHYEKEYRRVRELVTLKSRAYILTAKQQLEEKRRALFRARHEWKIFINTHPLIPSIAHI